MVKRPAFQFYPADWRKDPGVQSLSYHDRGVWFEIICLLHESEERGKLLLNGKPMPEDALARLLGLDKQRLNQTVSTLLDFGVASRCNETGALMSRRMVRDEAAVRRAKEDGATGGNPKLTTGYNAPGFLYAIRDPESGNVKIGIATNYQLRIKKIGYKLRRQMETLWVVPVDDMGTKEAQVHAELANMRVSGEWFKIPDSFVDTLKGIMKGVSKGEEKGKTRASSSSSSSSSDNIPLPPLGFAGENPVVEAPCTIEQAIEKGKELRISEEACAFWWHTRNAAGWMKSSASGHPRRITGWQSDLSTSRGWAEEQSDRSKAPGNGKSRELRSTDISL